MRNVVITEDQKAKVFFMIQAMEAWILSQPNKIEQWASQKGYIRVRSDKKLAEDNSLGEHPEKIIHHEDKLNTILQRYFTTKDGTKLKYKGKKLKFAPSMIEILDAEELVACFSEVKALQISLKASLHTNC